MIKKISSLIIFSSVLISVSYCSSPDTKKNPQAESSEYSALIPGKWILNKEETLRYGMNKRNVSWDKLTQSQKAQVSADFLLEFTVEFRENGQWNGRYKDPKGEYPAQGTYNIISSKGKTVTVRALSVQENQILHFNFIDEHSALLTLESQGSDVELFMDKVEN